VATQRTAALEGEHTGNFRITVTEKAVTDMAVTDTDSVTDSDRKGSDKQ